LQRDGVRLAARPFLSAEWRRYSELVKQIWTGRAAQVVGKYGENAPAAAVCCNACRTCVTTNLIAVATAAVGAVGYSAARLARRTLFAKRS
jgi:hypothetical protein